MQPLPLTPETCKVGDLIDRHLVDGWPRMTDKQAGNFRRWTGARLHQHTYLVRKDRHIFQVRLDHDKARCVYCHDRQF